MMKIYTPEQWTSVFAGCPQLVIDDEGFIYNGVEYGTMLGVAPVGKINYEQGWIHGKDYEGLMPKVVGYILKDEEATKIYAEEPGLMSTPILYIRDGKVYTAEAYHGFWPVESAVIKEEKPAVEKEVPSSSGSTRSSGMGMPFLELGVILVFGFVFAGLWEKNPPMFLWVIAVIANLVLILANVENRAAITVRLMRLKASVPEKKMAACQKNAFICALLAVLPLAAVGLWATVVQDVHADVRNILVGYMGVITLMVYYLVFRLIRARMCRGRMPQWPDKTE